MKKILILTVLPILGIIWIIKKRKRRGQNADY